MQKAIFDFIRRQFDGRVNITRISADLSLAKQADRALKEQKAGAKPHLCKSNRRIERRITFLFSGSSKRSRKNIRACSWTAASGNRCRYNQSPKSNNQDSSCTNYCPNKNKFSKSPPKVGSIERGHFVVHRTKIQSELFRLIKSRGKQQSRNMNVQIVAAEKLSQCCPVSFSLQRVAQ